MDFFESETQAFILRIWLEPREIEDSQPEWRGMIEHVPTGRRSYFHRIEDIPRLILPYLTELDIIPVKQESILFGIIASVRRNRKRYTERVPEVVSFIRGRVNRVRLSFTWLSRLQDWLRHRW